ncbi:hypothetical protein HanHA300_Chr11g0385631 [Helianthus annuus]|nr:hypothetical protein HanHA300_Chr11g0385631 [Helianthus annuus]KAJ0515905.1 hypothetical protein HanHA89_Chr11g0407981 [Helianthus annuus]KAJ0683924.1 hypothetical protein HanLR1_Chr11g0385621 [Helianthus annuus]KAJ0687879.1 hypothetical protein HanOQP8_Chr11g0388281 [Helianthus annuus]
MVNPREHLSNTCRVGNHAHCPLYLSEIASGYHRWCLVVNTTLEPSRAPVNELDSTLGLDGSDSCVHVLGCNVSSVHQTASHVLAVTGIALSHHRRWFERGVGDLSNRKLLVVRLLSGDNRSVRRKHEVDTRVRYEICLELGNVHVQRSVKPQRRGQ